MFALGYARRFFRSRTPRDALPEGTQTIVRNHNISPVMWDAIRQGTVTGATTPTSHPRAITLGLRPGLHGGEPITDALDKCDAKWAKLLGGQRYVDAAIRPLAAGVYQPE